MPDACVDVVWTSAGSVVVCGPEVRGWTFQVSGGSEAVGIRFRPGRAASALGVAMDEIRDQQVPIDAILGAAGVHLVDQLNYTATTAARIRLLQSHALRWTATNPSSDAATDYVARRLARDPAATVAQLGRELGFSERQLLRRCRVAFGYGPATLRRILRLQRFLRLSAEGSRSHGLSGLAIAAGYVDQQHLARDTGAIARATPSQLISARSGGQVMSDPSTTQRRDAGRLT